MPASSPIPTTSPTRRTAASSARPTCTARSRRAPGDHLSGTNLDDLGDWRPGLQAAAAHGVRHPYVEAGIDKATVRALARALGLDDLAELPAAPCLSSRLATGIAVTAERLRLVHAVERLIQRELAPRRCAAGCSTTASRSSSTPTAWSASRPRPRRRCARRDRADHRPRARVRYEPYRMGSAFLRPAADGV